MCFVKSSALLRGYLGAIFLRGAQHLRFYDGKEGDCAAIKRFGLQSVKLGFLLHGQWY